LPRASGSPGVAAVVLAVIATFVIIVTVAASARRGTLRPNGGSSGPRLDVAALANVSLAVTPAVMATMTHVPVGNNEYMSVPLSGSAFDSIAFQWKEADLSHAYGFTLSFGTSPPDVAAMTRRVRAVLGSHMSAAGSYSWQAAGGSFTKDDVSVTVRVDDDKPGGNDPHWKQELDTLWDVVRADVLGLKVPVDDDAVRDWLGRGRPLSLLASLDPATDVDASAAAVGKIFPGVRADRWGPIEYRIALDHPLFDGASLVWENHSHAELEKAIFHRTDANDKAANQAALEACLQSAYGPPTWRTETDHVNGTYSSRWSVEGVDGAIEAYSGDVFVMVEAFVPSRSGKPASSSLSTAAWQRTVGVLDACGRH
jgi:hypothetical protein